MSEMGINQFIGNNYDDTIDNVPSRHTTQTQDFQP